MQKDKLTDVDVRVMVVQPTKDGIEEIAHDRIKVPYLINEKTKNIEKPKVKKVQKPKMKTVEKVTEEKVGRTEE